MLAKPWFLVKPRSKKNMTKSDIAIYKHITWTFKKPCLLSLYDFNLSDIQIKKQSQLITFFIEMSFNTFLF